jgi:hypothetical protein
LTALGGRNRKRGLMAAGSTVHSQLAKIEINANSTRMQRPNSTVLLRSSRPAKARILIDEVGAETVIALIAG